MKKDKKLFWKLDDVLPVGKFEEVYAEVEKDLEKV